jgi:hypothetical protein
VDGLSGWGFAAFTRKSYPMISEDMHLVTRWSNGIILRGAGAEVVREFGK